MRWPCAEAFFEEHGEGGYRPRQRGFHDAVYGKGVPGVRPRSRGSLRGALSEAYAHRCVRIPTREGLRSLNLSNAVAVAAYEALRQQGWPGLV